MILQDKLQPVCMGCHLPTPTQPVSYLEACLWPLDTSDFVLLARILAISHLWVFLNLWIVAHQAPPSVLFSRQEYWSGLPFPPPGDLPNPGIELLSTALQVDSLPAEPLGKPLSLLPLWNHFQFLQHWECLASARLYPSFTHNGQHMARHGVHLKTCVELEWNEGDSTFELSGISVFSKGL